MASASATIRSLKKGPEHREAVARVRAWTRERFRLAETETIIVAEVACGLPGCPPLETVVAFWTEDTTRHQFKVFKPVREVTRDDLPFAWLKGSLAVPEGFGCDCC
jgi:nitrate reductase delta subunit